MAGGSRIDLSQQFKIQSDNPFERVLAISLGLPHSQRLEFMQKV
jgi:hypothetical protein